MKRELPQCRHCGGRFAPSKWPKNPADLVLCCGKTPCFQLEYWKAADWAAAADMARIRLGLMEAGIPSMLEVTGFVVHEISPTTMQTTRTYAMGPMSLSALDRLALRKAKRAVAA